MEVALIPRIAAATTALEERVAAADMSKPDELRRLLTDLGAAKQIAAIAGLDEQAARISVAKDRLLERLSENEDLFPVGAGRPTGNSRREREIPPDPEAEAVKRAVHDHRSEWKDVPPERREEVRAECVAEGEPLTRRLRRAEKHAARRSEKPAVRQPTAPASGLYSVILADPPWRYENAVAPERNAVENHYPTMTPEQLGSIEVPAAKDALLLLWATNPKLKEALLVMQDWGFQYRTNAAWVKDRYGTGHWFRGQHELLLLGRRGNFRTPEDAHVRSSVFEAPRGRHSEKPEIVQDWADAAFPGERKLEMFARRPRAGWDAWGNEAGGE